MKRLVFSYAVMMLAAFGVAVASPVPIAVSPGSIERTEQIADACPTFSWGAVSGANAYKLVVYEVTADGELGDQVIEQEASGSALTWTPPLRQCLDRAKTYAWTVGAVGASTISWSEPALFRIVVGSTEEEFRDALEVVKGYLEAHEELTDAASKKAAAPRSNKANKDHERAATAAREKSGGALLNVNGTIAATSFTGDGSALSGIVATGGGTITGDLDIDQDLVVNGTISASALTLNGEPLGNLSSVTEPVVYTPAVLTCGVGAESNSAQWGSLASGTLRITLEGVGYDIAVSFVGVANMDDVALRIQDGINVATGGSETVVWDTDHFIITSADTTISSSLAPLATHSGAMPIDISGAGVNDWMDCDTGNGAVSLARINLPFYEGSMVRLNAEGFIDPLFVAPEIKVGVSQFFVTSGTDTKTITHNLGRVPRRIRIRWYAERLTDSNRNEGEGIFDGTNYATVFEFKSGNPGQSPTFSTTHMIVVDFESFGFNWKAVIGEMNEDTFTLDIDSFDDGATIHFLWEVM